MNFVRGEISIKRLIEMKPEVVWFLLYSSSFYYIISDGYLAEHCSLIVRAHASSYFSYTFEPL